MTKKSSNFRARAIAVAIALVAPIALVVGIPATASAANGADFNPEYIISDDVFFNDRAMNVDEVQTFFEQKAPACGSGQTCIDTFTVSTTGRAPDAYCAGYAGRPNESAAKIIVKVAESCGINPQVLIVMLQKEQGLITYRSNVADPNLNDSRYARAMGYACPDTAPCNALYFGFHNQVYSAARQYQVYSKNPNSYNYRVGAGNIVGYHPKSWNNPATCPKVTLNIRNQATANLYIYTPYVPNATALSDVYGAQSDGCSSYGNRNFWRYFTDWFGSPTNGPFGRLDTVTSSLTEISLSGWAIDPDTGASIRTHVYANGAYLTGLTASLPRTDVAGVYPAYGAAHGYRATIPVSPGNYEICTYGINVGPGKSQLLGCKTTRVLGESPIGRVDTAVAGIGSVDVAGWSIDPSTVDPTLLHVYLNGVNVNALTYADTTRTDVGAAYPGYGDSHGYALTLPVTQPVNQVCVYGINVGGGKNALHGCRTVTVPMGNPMGRVDAVEATDGGILARGWAIDPDTAGSIRYHLYVDGKYAGNARANLTRTDVGAAYPLYGSSHGYSITAPVASGAHTVCVYGLNVGSGKNALLACKPVVVP